MGSLTPNKTLIYERVNGVTYARESGADPSTRTEVGWGYDPRTSDGRPLHDHIMDDKLWGDIRRAAKTDPSLQAALDRVKVTYYLTEDYEKRYGGKSKF